MRTLAKHRWEVGGVPEVSGARAAEGGSTLTALGSGATTSTGSGGAPFNVLNFSPQGFILPADRRSWLKAAEADPKVIWIVKPPASSCGRGIRVVSKANTSSVNKSKKVYLFEEGLVRLSTKRYNLKNLKSRFTHLTNYSINKKSEHFKAPGSEDNDTEAQADTSANKWALTLFWKHLDSTVGKKKREEVVERSIDDVVLRTMVAADGDMATHSHQLVRHRGSCYELFGFDVLLDETFKPWLLEVNISPSLFGSSPLDRRIKGTLMADIFHLVGFRPFDRTALRREERREAKHIPGTRRTARSLGGRPQ
ncbi:unnamed protein product, partial [Choristocarpus tenellus]